MELDGYPPLSTLSPGETKTNNGRTLPILGEMLDTLRALQVEHDQKWPTAAHVFLNEAGKLRKALGRSLCLQDGKTTLDWVARTYLAALNTHRLSKLLPASDDRTGGLFLMNQHSYIPHE